MKRTAPRTLTAEERADLMRKGWDPEEINRAEQDLATGEGRTISRLVWTAKESFPTAL